MTSVVNYKRGEEGDVSIMRPGPFGNPYHTGIHGSREWCCAMYRKHLKVHPELVSRGLAELQGKRLICGCKPLQCHGDTWVEILDGFKVLVCGGRDFEDRDQLFAVMDRIHARRPIQVIIEGEAPGADRLARAWALSRDVLYAPFPADWNNPILRKRAGFVRNAQMLREGRPTLVVAFPGGNGTRHMVRISKEAHVPVYQVAKATKVAVT